MDGTLYYVHQDHLGSTVALSDAAGGEVGRVQYDPYGEVLTSTLPVTLTDRLFTGARFDGTIGLYQMGARWYDPVLGRWIQADTIVPNPTNPQDLNRYTYVRNNPLRYTDPSGHYIFEDDPSKPYFLIPSLPPQPLDTTWDDPLIFWIESGGFYAEGSIFWKVGGRTVGPFSVYVPPADPYNWPDYGFQEGWRQRGGTHIGIADMTKPGFGNRVSNFLASYAAAHSQDIPSTMAIVPQRINVDPKYIGQDQDIYVPGQYEMGGLGSGSQLEAAVSLPAAIMPGENIGQRYVSITIERKGDLCRALVVSHYPREAYISYQEEGPWYKETPMISDPTIATIDMDWSSTTLGRRW